MKKKILAAMTAVVISGSAMAQSAFQGFYGQISTGYENNSVSNLGMSAFDATNGITDSYNSGNQSFGGAPLVIGLGYNFSVAPKWLFGIGVDYSALSQKSSSYGESASSANGFVSLNGATIQMSNRVNFFVAPGYEISKDQLIYLKAGYSMVTQKINSPNSYICSGVDCVGPSGSLASGSQSKTLSGYILGLGYKQIITGGLYGFAEFNYMSYGKPTYSGQLDTDYNATVSPSTNSYQGLIGVGYKF